MEVNKEKIHKEINQLYGNVNMNPDNQLAQVQLADSKNSRPVISPEEAELHIILYTVFQFSIEKATELMASEEQIKKDQAIKIIKSLMENPFLRKFKSNKIIYASVNGILNYYLGLANLSAEDQTICEGPFNKALDYFNTLPNLIKVRYINIYQEIYNNLGIIYYNKGEIKKGLQNLGKAEQMYQIFSALNGYVFTNSFDKFMKSCSSLTEEGNNSNEIEFFNFFVDGGLNKKKFEHNYTLTLFFYAQAFTKLRFRKKAIKYCSQTLKRQIDYNEYELKDALMNCINLSDFFMENQHYAQAEYILISAMSLLPEDVTKKKKLRAAVQKQLGKYFLERLRFAVSQARSNIYISQNEELSAKVNKMITTFTTLNIVWPKIEDVRSVEQAKILFRLANTQFKKALEFYLMDGYVTEHIEISRDISQLYKYLIEFETDNNRIVAMLERRINLLEPIVSTINHKVYVVQWQELSLELAEIYGELFDCSLAMLRLSQRKVKAKEIEEINTKGEKSIFYYKDIIGYIVDEYNKETEKILDDFVTIITIKSNLARMISKLIYPKDIKRKVEALKESLKLYNEVKSLLKSSPTFLNENPSLQENLKMCEEMVGMLPVKIDKINRGEEI